MCSYIKLRQILQEQGAEFLNKLNKIKASWHNSLCVQKGDNSSLENLLNCCRDFISKVTSKEWTNGLLTHTAIVFIRKSMISLIISLKPVCRADYLMLFTSTPNDYVSHFTSLCKVPSLPLNCTVKSLPAMNKHGPVCVIIVLKDNDDCPVSIKLNS